jgi:predicted AAA+ superfamily ATPase
MMAHAQGSQLNASQVGSSLDVSYHTVIHYLDVLEQTFLVRRLPPFFRNVGKRLAKRPKVYLRDTGLLHHLLNITTHADLASHPIRGSSWETLVLEDIIRRERLAHPSSQFFFWRTAAGAEVDLVIERGSERYAIEVKAGRAIHPRATHTLAEAAKDIGAAGGWIVDQGEGIESLRPGIWRRGIAESLEWLPPS